MQQDLALLDVHNFLMNLLYWHLDKFWLGDCFLIFSDVFSIRTPLIIMTGRVFMQEDAL